MQRFGVFLPAGHCHNLALTVVYVAYSYGSGTPHIRQPRPDSGLSFPVKVLETFKGVPSSLNSDLGDTSEVKTEGERAKERESARVCVC